MPERPTWTLARLWSFRYNNFSTEVVQVNVLKIPAISSLYDGPAKTSTIHLVHLDLYQILPRPWCWSEWWTPTSLQGQGVGRNDEFRPALANENAPWLGCTLERNIGVSELTVPVSVSVCMYVCMYVCLYVGTFKERYIQTDCYIIVCTYMPAVPVSLSVCMCVCIHTDTSGHFYTLSVSLRCTCITYTSVPKYSSYQLQLYSSW